MKKYTLLSIVMISLLISACKKDNQDAVVGISGIKGTSAWKTPDAYTGFKPLATKDTLFIVGQNGEENIVIGIKQRGTGTYSPSEFKAYFYVTIGLDVVVGRYQLSNDPANSIRITDYDETTHVVKGSFNLVFKSAYIYNSTKSDEFTFTYGKINTQLSDVYLDPYTGF